MNVAVGFVVAGGRSLRMGRDKALVRWQGSTLLDHALGRVREVCGDVRILCGAAPRYQDHSAPIVVDRIADAGPLAGLDAALAAAQGRPALLLAVDLPFVTPGLLALLLDLLAGWDAVVPVVGGRPEPLCAVYGPRCLPSVASRLAKGERRMTSFWPDVSVRQPGQPDLGGVGNGELLFRNFNTPRDFDGSPT